MKLIVSAPHLDSRQRRAFEELLHKAVPSISRRLGSVAPQDPRLRARLTAEGSSQGGRIIHHLTLSLQLSDHPVVVHKSGPDAAGLVDESVKALKKELQRTASRIRKDQLNRRRGSVREAFSTFLQEVPSLPSVNGSAVKREDMETNPFFARLRPLLGPLHSYSRDQLDAAQAASELPDNYLSPDDLVDQAVLRVLEDGKAALRDAQTLEQQLYRYVDEILAEEVSQRQPGVGGQFLSLEQEAPEDQRRDLGADATEVEENEYYQPWAMLRLEDVLIDDRAEEPGHMLSESEERRLLLKHLGGFHSKARSAFYLNRVEGFETYEIAMIQNREEDVVKADIEACVRTLQSGWNQVDSGSSVARRA